MREGVDEGPARSEAHGDEAVESPPMDARIWALLPPELHENILAGLPVVQLFRMRTVCRRFQALTQLPSFVSSWTAMAAPEHWLLMFNHEDARFWISMSAYDPRVKHWYNLPVHDGFFVPRRRFFVQLPTFALWGEYSLASAHGLVCIPPMEHTQTLALWNPLTNVSRELPGMSIKGEMHVGFMVDSATKSFVVVAVGLTEESLKITEVYHSAEGFWKPMHTSFIEWCGSYFSPLVHWNGCFHAIASHETTLNQFCLISYDLKQGFWKEMCKLPMPGSLCDASPSLFDVAPRRLFLAARTIFGPRREEPILLWDRREEPYAIHLWELKPLEEDDGAAAVEWIQVAEVPQEMRRESWATCWFECHAVGNLVCFIAAGDRRGLVYDLTRDAWHWMPRRQEHLREHVVSFEPRLDMLSA